MSDDPKKTDEEEIVDETEGSDNETTGVGRPPFKKKDEADTDGVGRPPIT